MHSLEKIASIIEERAVLMYGSVNKMLLENQLSKSVLDNMKRKKPSAPNILTLCRLAEILQISADSLLGLEDALSTDEQALLDGYKKLAPQGKALLQKELCRLQAEYPVDSDREATNALFFSDKK